MIDIAFSDKSSVVIGNDAERAVFVFSPDGSDFVRVNPAVAGEYSFFFVLFKSYGIHFFSSSVARN